MAKNKEKKHVRISTIIIVLILIAGVAIMAYPTFSDWYNRLHQSRAIDSYNEAVAENDDESNEEMWKQARAYNDRLAEKYLANGGTPDFNLTDEEQKEYESILDVSGTGIMGYIDIDKVHIHLPIYHDTTDSVLQIAVGHLAGSSLPVGGKSSHSIITGHTGLPSARLFTDIDQLAEGDTFQITVLDHVLTYEVDDIRTVLPSELDTLGIEEGRDLVTLVTCTPYGINTHRLLVTGHRIPTPKKDAAPSDDWQENTWLHRLLLALPFIIAGAVIVIIVAVVRHRRRHRKKMNQSNQTEMREGQN